MDDDLKLFWIIISVVFVLGAATGGRKPYQKGYRFETKVRKALENAGYLVKRQHKSAFPDLTARELDEFMMDQTEWEVTE